MGRWRKALREILCPNSKLDTQFGSTTAHKYPETRGVGDQPAWGVLSLIIAPEEWIFRRTESIRMSEGSVTRRRVSVDCMIPAEDSMSYWRTAPGATGLMVVPLAMMRKGILVSLDTSFENNPLPVLNRQENSELSADIICAVAYRFDKEFRDDCVRLCGADPDKSTEDELIRRYQLKGSDAEELVKRFAKEFVFACLVPSAFAGSRAVLKYSMYLDLSRVGAGRAGAWDLLLCSTGWKSISATISSSGVSEKVSSHIEFCCPTGLESRFVVAPPAPPPPFSLVSHMIRPGGQRGSSSVDAGVASTSDSDSTVTVELRVPSAGARTVTGLLVAYTFLFFLLTMALPGAFDVLRKSGDQAAGYLLIPVAIAGLLLGANESKLVSSVLFPLRTISLVCGVLLVGALTSFVGQLEPLPLRFYMSLGLLVSAALVLLVTLPMMFPALPSGNRRDRQRTAPRRR